MRSLVVVLLACLASPVTGHAIMINPTPRTGTDGGGQGNKLQPFGDARNSNCGGANNGDPPPFNAALRQPTEAFTPGSSINVQWELTIPHDADNTDIGVRVAVHYSCDDSFNDNILVGCLDGDPGCDDQTNAGVYLNRKAAAPAGSPAGTTVGAIITLPPGKTSNYAVMVVNYDVTRVENELALIQCQQQVLWPATARKLKRINARPVKSSSGCLAASTHLSLPICCSSKASPSKGCS